MRGVSLPQTQINDPHFLARFSSFRHYPPLREAERRRKGGLSGRTEVEKVRRLLLCRGLKERCSEEEGGEGGEASARRGARA